MPVVSLLTVPEVCARLSVSRQSLYRLLKTDPMFPRPVYPARRAPRWRDDDIAAWIDRLSGRLSGAA